jgi:hypothetical protein
MPNMNRDDRNNSVKSFLELLSRSRHRITSVSMADSRPGAVLLRDVLWSIKNPIPKTGKSGASHGLHMLMEVCIRVICAG